MMIKRGMKRGFTLVELLVAVAIIAVLSVFAYIGIEKAQSRGMNQRMADDLNAIVNALEQYKKDKGNYPDIADGSLRLGVDGGNSNVNCFNEDTAYDHDCSTAAFIQTQVDNTVLTKRYLQEVPTDPRTHSRYAYGVTTDGKYYQVAGNWLNDDGSYTAKVMGNLQKGYELASLIRAYNGPNFVMEGDVYLPYSPDFMAVTARVEKMTPPVTATLDGAPVTVVAGTVLKVNTKIATGAGGSAVLYFSDGSVTYLDPGTELWITPGTRIEQNDKDGIITKIRLKLTSGKIWNKVVRLAQKSQFNVETTAAIAGVRGTEFGIDVSTPIYQTDPRLIVLSGDVAARKKGSTDAAGTAYMEFDPTVGSSPDDTFKTIQVVSGNGADFTQYTVPEANALTAPAGSAVAAEPFRAAYYGDYFNNNMRPRILEIQTKTSPVFIKFHWPQNVSIDYFKKILVYKEGDLTNSYDSFGPPFKHSESGHWISVNAADITYFGNAKLMLRFRFEGGYNTASSYFSGFSDPVIPVEKNIVLSEAEIYNVMAAAGDQGQPCGGTPQSVAITTKSIAVLDSYVDVTAEAFYPNNCHQTVTSQCVWDLNSTVGTIDQPTGKMHIDPNYPGTSFIFACQYQGTPSNQFLVNVVKKLQGACYGTNLKPDLPSDPEFDDVGYWDQQSPTCWVLGPKKEDPMPSDKSCTATCKDKLKINGNSIAQCDPGATWNDCGPNGDCSTLSDNCVICAALGGDQTTCSVVNISPSRAPNRTNGTLCRYRKTNLTADCVTQPGTLEERICACISL